MPQIAMRALNSQATVMLTTINHLAKGSHRMGFFGMGFVGKESISSHPIGNPDPVNTMKEKINIIYTAMAIIIIITLIMVGVTTNLRIINITIAGIKNLRIIKIIINTIITSLHIITIAIKMAIKNLHIIIIINTIIIIRIRNIRIKIIIIFIKDINLVITSTKVIRIKIISQGSKRQVWILLLKLNVIVEVWDLISAPISLPARRISKSAGLSESSKL